MKLADLVSIFQGHNTVLFKLTGFGEAEYDTVDFADAFCEIEALQQENEQLQGRNTTYVNENANQAKEIERLQDENISIKNWNACEAEQFSELLESDKRRIELEEEVEQLQAQATQYREALIIANHRMPDVGQFCACGNCKICGATISYAGYEYCVSCARVIIDEALSDTPADYHNPDDVAALKQARETIEHHLNKAKIGIGGGDDLREVLAAIDKMGGREDV